MVKAGHKYDPEYGNRILRIDLYIPDHCLLQV